MAQVRSHLRLYHGSWSGNIPSILEKGIVPRSQLRACDTYIDDILAEYGLRREDVPEWMWKYPLSRCKETSEKVYLSADPAYATGNALAGFEAEDDLRRYLAKLTGQEYKPPERPVTICEVEVPAELVEGEPQWHWTAKKELTKWETVEHAKQFIPELFEDEEDIIKGVFRQVKLDRVPAEWIKACRPVAKP